VQWEREWTESLNAESKSPKEQVKTQEKEEQKEEEKEEKTLSSNIRSSMKRNITEKENANNQRDNDTMDDGKKINHIHEIRASRKEKRSSQWHYILK